MKNNNKRFNLKTALFLATLGFLGLLFVTNPTMDQYEQFVRQQLLTEANAKGQVGQTLGTMFSGIASHFVADATLRHDYFFVSIFEAEFGDQHMRALGILNHFIKLDSQTTQKSTPADDKTTSNKPAGQPVANAEKKKADINTVRHDFKAGPITVSVRSKCSPLMEDCDSDAELHYRSQILKIAPVGWPTHPVTENEISWIENRYVMIGHGREGNCWDCSGVAVAELDGESLYYLGKFNRVEGGYLMKVYDELEHNNLTSHAAAPGWGLYFKPVNHEAVLDVKHTCQIAKEDFDKDKKEFLSVLSPQKSVAWMTGKVQDTPVPTSDQIVTPLLRTLSLARYCSWQDEYLEILTAAKSSQNKLLPWKTLEAISTELSKINPPPVQ